VLPGEHVALCHDAVMTTGRDKDDDATAIQPKPPATWAARQAERDSREGRELHIPAVRTPAHPAESVFYVEIREEKPGADAKVVFAATGTMEDIAPSLQTIAKKFDSRWWAFWRRRNH
jgi:hypothetical protein